MASLRLLVLGTILCAPLAAVADPPRLLTVTVPSQHHEGALENQIIYLNKCATGCMIRPGTDDSSTGTSSIASKTATLAGVAWAPGEWEAVLQCVKEVYSPYNITVTDVQPSASYQMTVIGGAATDIGLPGGGIGGIATVTNDCTPLTNSIAFVFGDLVDTFAQEDGGNRVWGTCWTIAQETAHLYGLDHEYAFLDGGRSACNDPMTYRSDCGGQKFFRNAAASCGEFGPARPGCGPSNSCSTAQNSHAKMLATLGAGTPITGKPTTSITMPAANAMVTGGSPVFATAFAQRGVAKLELWINGYKWGEVKGAEFGNQGQLESTYPLNIPTSVPDSILDLQVKAYDDLGIEGDSAIVTVTKGAPCTTATTCAAGQKCDAGKCYWDPAVGQFGDSCTYPQFCVSGICQGTADKQICTVNCIPGATDSCQMGYDCVATSGTGGICFPQDSGGCCSVGHESHAVWIHGGLAGLVLGLLLRRRRRP